MPRRSDRTPIDSKWVFKVQQVQSGGDCRYKARLCARGFKQKKGLDFTETFSPVVRYDSLHVLLALVTEKDLELVQFDVRTAFLYGELTEDIHMEIPEGLSLHNEQKKMVCKLSKALYGLKQASRCWNRKFVNFLKQFNLMEGEADKCIFHGTVDGFAVYLGLYVDDGLIAVESQRVIDSMIGLLRAHFIITLGDASSFVRIEIERDRENRSLFLHQKSYTRRIIEKFRMSDAR